MESIPPFRISPAPPPPASYDVVVEPGALERLPELLAEAAPAHRYALVTDTHVAPLWGEALAERLRGAGLAVEGIAVPAGEAEKTRESWARIHDRMSAMGFGRDACVLALGGGVVGDLAGFAAATFLRGIPVVQLPTSLLAMVDAAVGGKTGIDTPAGKNLAGAFHHPRLVVADPQTLSTLPEQELRSGLAEALKHGAIADRAYFDRIVADAPALLARRPEPLAALVRRSVEIKAGFAAADPYEQGPRQALNFGHTIGHAVEAASGYRLPHGFAVAVGMVAEAAAGEAAGVTEAGTAAALRDALAALNLPVTVSAELDRAQVLEATRTDKKARASRVRYVLLARVGATARGPGGEWSFALDGDAVRRALDAPAERA